MDFRASGPEFDNEMASSMRTAMKLLVVAAFMSTMAVAVNAQAAGPAPAPQSGAASASMVPTVVAPALCILLAFFASRILS